MNAEPCFLCGGSGTALYQPEGSWRVQEEVCHCPDPRAGVKPMGSGKTLGEIFEAAAKSWEAAGRGKWGIKTLSRLSPKRLPTARFVHDPER